MSEVPGALCRVFSLGWSIGDTSGVLQDGGVIAFSPASVGCGVVVGTAHWGESDGIDLPSFPLLTLTVRCERACELQVRRANRRLYIYLSIYHLWLR